MYSHALMGLTKQCDEGVCVYLGHCVGSQSFECLLAFFFAAQPLHLRDVHFYPQGGVGDITVPHQQQGLDPRREVERVGKE